MMVGLSALSWPLAGGTIERYPEPRGHARDRGDDAVLRGGVFYKKMDVLRAERRV